MVAAPRWESLRGHEWGFVAVFYQVYYELKGTLFFYVLKKKKKNKEKSAFN